MNYPFEWDSFSGNLNKDQEYLIEPVNSITFTSYESECGGRPAVTLHQGQRYRAKFWRFDNERNFSFAMREPSEIEYDCTTFRIDEVRVYNMLGVEVEIGRAAIKEFFEQLNQKHIRAEIKSLEKRLVEARSKVIEVTSGTQEEK